MVGAQRGRTSECIVIIHNFISRSSPLANSIINRHIELATADPDIAVKTPPL